jgi:hypothetical protein
MARMTRLQALLLIGALLASGTTLAYGQLGKILKGGAIALAVDRFGPQINNGINSLTGDKHLSASDMATKVVPILSIGGGGYLGAVQVAGPEEQVEKVKAVAQLEGKVNVIGGVRLRALIPISARSTSNIQRVPGVGVSALVDIKL